MFINTKKKSKHTKYGNQIVPIQIHVLKNLNKNGLDHEKKEKENKKIKSYFFFILLIYKLNQNMTNELLLCI